MEKALPFYATNQEKKKLIIRVSISFFEKETSLTHVSDYITENY